MKRKSKMQPKIHELVKKNVDWKKKLEITKILELNNIIKKESIDKSNFNCKINDKIN